MKIIDPILSGSVLISGSFIVNGVDTSQGAVTSSFALTSSFAEKIGHDVVGYTNISPEFKSTVILTAGGAINVDCSTAQTFTLSPNQNFTLNVTNPRVGQTKFIVITGAGGGYGQSWTVEGSTGTFNRIAGGYNDTSGMKNFIQLSCVSSTEFWYSISQIDS